MRVFIAIEPPEDVKEKVVALRDYFREMNSGMKWVEKQNIHITLRFMGEINEPQVEALKGILASTVENFTEFEISLSGVGFFPDIKFPRVMWVGVEKGKKELINLAAAIERNVSKHFPKEDREFKPHFTIARVKSKIDTSLVAERLKSFNSVEIANFIADEVKIMQSILRPAGPLYLVVQHYKLKRC